MLTTLRPRLTYANVMATIAVFLALGGASYAAIKIPNNSVGTSQLKSNAVISSKMKNGTLLAVDFKAGQLPAGAKGEQGIQGPPGNDGQPGAPGATNVVVRIGSTHLTASSTLATCNAGERATGGGGASPTATDPLLSSVAYVATSTTASPATGGQTPNAWNVSMAAGQQPTAFVVCASP